MKNYNIFDGFDNFMPVYVIAFVDVVAVFAVIHLFPVNYAQLSIAFRAMFDFSILWIHYLSTQYLIL